MPGKGWLTIRCNLFIPKIGPQLLVIEPGFLYNKFAAFYLISIS